MVASRGPLPPVGAARVAVQVCATLAAAHAQGRTHGHLTPANVLLRIDGQVELTGFRLAPAARPLAAAPDPDDDLRALGRCMVVMLTGREPAAGKRVIPGPEVPPELAAIVTRAAGLQRSYRSADHLGRDLARFLATAASSEAPAHRPSATGPTSAGSVRLLSSSPVASPRSAAPPGAASSPARHRRGLAPAAGLVGAGLFLVGAVVAVGLVGGEPTGPDTDQTPAPPSTPVPATTRQPAVGGAATTTVPATTATPPPAPAGQPGSGQAAGPGQRTVPDVVGLHRQQAVGVLTEAQLGVQIIRFQVDASGQVQRVVAQQPPAGQVVPAESVVRLLVGTRRPST